jgi:hypothetical protein
MQASEDIIFIVTTMDGVPVIKDDGSIVQFRDTTSCRNNAKHRTYSEKTRHHSRGLTRKQFFAAKKEYTTNKIISM